MQSELESTDPHQFGWPVKKLNPYELRDATAKQSETRVPCFFTMGLSPQNAIYQRQKDVEWCKLGSTTGKGVAWVRTVWRYRRK